VKRGVQRPTVRRDLTMLVAALNHAVKEGRMKVGDVPAIALPPENEPRLRWLSDAETARAFTVAAEISAERSRMSRVERWLFIAYHTGRRKAAVEGLAWDRVDFELNTIDFEVPGRRRTKKRRGVAFMNAALRAAMERAHLERRGEFVLDHPGDIRRAFATLRQRAGFGREVTIHVVKHATITHMLRRGVSVWDVAGATQTSPATIMRVYGKHVPEAQRRAMEALAPAA
jgi:integrase